MIRLAVALVTFGTACDRVFNIDELDPVLEPDALVPDARGEPCATDHFTAAIDPTLLVVEQPASPVMVLAENGGLVIRPPVSLPGYNAAVTIDPRDLTNGSVQVTVQRVLAVGDADTQLKVTPDLAGDKYFLIYNHATYIGFREETAARNEDGITYSSILHRYWRIRFVGADTVVFETSASGADGEWIERHTAAIDFPITRLYGALVAGTYNAGVPDPGEAVYDDFKICTAP